MIALVTGGNRGIGFEVCRKLALKGHDVILTSRSEARGKEAVEKLQKQDLKIRFHPLDVTSGESIERVIAWISREIGKLDILINNAGVFMDHGDQGGDSAFTSNVETLRETMETNVYGPFQLCQKLISLMRKNGFGRVVNLSSGMGQLSEMNGGYPAYRISKTALNAVTRIFSDETQGEDVLVNSVCPGWVKTEMGGEDAERPPEEAADTIVWLATLPKGSELSGGFYRDRKKIDW